jgi:hypothetical protein
VLGNVVIRGEDISVSGLGLGEARPVPLVQTNRGRSSQLRSILSADILVVIGSKEWGSSLGGYSRFGQQTFGVLAVAHL